MSETTKPDHGWTPVSELSQPQLQVPDSLPGLNADENDLLRRCGQVWAQHVSKNLLRTSYYEAHEPLRSFGLTLPQRIRNDYTPLGWARKAVDMLADLCVLEGFVAPGKSNPFNLEEMASTTHLMGTVQRAIQTALIHGCSFITVGRDSNLQPLIRTATAESTAAVWDYQHDRVQACLAINDFDDEKNATGLILYLPGRTLSYAKDERGDWQITGQELIPNGLCAAFRLAYKPSQIKPFGRSRISRDAMGLIDGANRILLRTEANEEFYAYPKYLLLGTSPEFTQAADENALHMYMGRWNAISKDEDGDRPSIVQLSAAPMDPHLNMLKTWASMFASLMNIPAASLGVVSDANPTSADAVEAQRNDLIIEAKHACREFGEGILDAVRLAIMLDPSQQANLTELAQLQLDWVNPSMPATSMSADAFSKLATSIQGFGDSEVGWEKAGLSRAEIIRLRADQEKARARAMVEQLRLATAQSGSDNNATQPEAQQGQAAG